ncbi:MAG: hypothetical protein KF861_14275 [Planctomycetaceae bacterium]|nr:hypothetical protein [Planctomycetaceae bacterium]
MRVASQVMLSIAVLTVSALTVGSANAESIYGTPRQYYSGYTYVPSHGYGYRTYYYKPTPEYAGYDYHYVIYPQHDPHHAYYYNPHTKAYWGRCPSQGHGEPYYSLLRPIHRKPTLAEIPESAFPKPGPLPPIPGAKDNAVLDLAPNDTPVVPAPVPGAAAPPVGTPPPVAAPPGAGAPPAAGPPPGVPTIDAPPPDAPPAVAAAPPPA